MAEFSIDTVSSSMFRLSIQRFDQIYALLEEDLIVEIKRMRAMGIPDDVIFEKISDSLLNGMDMFQRFRGALEREIDIVIGVSSQAEASGVMEQTEEMLVWVLDPTVQEHCDDCLQNSESGAKSFEDWVTIGLPGFGNTQCLQYCRCSLETK